MSRFTATTVLVLSVCAAALAVPAIAEACSCAGPNSEQEIGPYYAERIEVSDAAVIARATRIRVREGRPTLSDDEAVFTFRIKRSFKGLAGKRKVKVHTSLYGASCGLELDKGQRAGLLLDRRRNQWQGNLCGQIPPDWLRRGAEALGGSERLSSSSGGGAGACNGGPPV